MAPSRQTLTTSSWQQKNQASALNRINWSKVVEVAVLKLTRSVSPVTFAMWNMNLPEEVRGAPMRRYNHA